MCLPPPVPVRGSFSATSLNPPFRRQYVALCNGLQQELLELWQICNGIGSQKTGVPILSLIKIASAGQNSAVHSTALRGACILLGCRIIAAIGARACTWPNRIAQRVDIHHQQVRAPIQQVCG